MNFTPVDPNATEEVKKVLSFFADIEGKGIITGQLTLTCVNSTCMNMPLRWTNCRNCMRWNEGQAYIEFSRKKQIEWEEDRTVAARSFLWVQGAECHLCGDIDRLWKISGYLFLQWYTANQRGGQT